MTIISYHQLTIQENGLQVQKGMNFGVRGSYSIVLMSTAKNAPYVDEVLDDGVIEYEGHDAPKSIDYNKKEIDQPAYTKKGSLTENGKFLKATEDYKNNLREAAKIKVYRKIKPGVWVDMGFYDLIDAYVINDGKRNVFKFLLEPHFDFDLAKNENIDIVHNRQIPGDIQREVYERDKGKCQQCGSEENLHFDHILPFSKGGSSKIASNIQLLCAKHNLQKGAKFI
ncbi:HNH endonuclease [Amylibacter sp.]|nr:HNH endonuclease [Amylibacter sp.]MDC1455786.1 HNH endonuclease [Amylibacter sp.]